MYIEDFRYGRYDPYIATAAINNAAATAMIFLGMGFMFMAYREKINGNGKEKEKVDINRKHIEQKKSLRQISCRKRYEKAALNHSQSVFFTSDKLEKLPIENDKYGNVGKESYKPRFRQIVENNAMGPVKPGFRDLPGDIMALVEIFIEDSAEILGTPSQNRTLFEAFPCRIPGPKTGLSGLFGKADIEEAASRKGLDKRG
jgi:hypothetical protein